MDTSIAESLKSHGWTAVAKEPSQLEEGEACMRVGHSFVHFFFRRGGQWAGHGVQMPLIARFALDGNANALTVIVDTACEAAQRELDKLT